MSEQRQVMVWDVGQPVRAMNSVTRSLEKVNSTLDASTKYYKTVDEKGKTLVVTWEKQLDIGTKLTGTLRLQGAVWHKVGESVEYTTKAVDKLTAAELRHMKVVDSVNAKREAARFRKLPAAQQKSYVDPFSLNADIEGERLQSLNQSLAKDKRNYGVGSIFEEAKAHEKTATRIAKASTDKADAYVKNNERIALSWQGIIRIIEAQLLFRVIAQVVQQLSEATRTAEQFSIRLAEIQTISQKAGTSNKQLSNEIYELSNAFGLPVLQVVEGYYQAISNQTVTAANATAFMREEAKLATVAVSTLDEAVNSTTSILNAFGMNISEAARVNAILFKGVDLGRMRLDELANSLGRVSLFSKQLGITFEEQTAVLTTLTVKGIQLHVAETLLANVQKHLMQPTKEMNALFREWGVTSGKVAIDTFGFIGVLRKMAKAAEESGDAASYMAGLWQDIRATVGGIGLTQSLDTFETHIAKMLTEASGEYEKAVDIVMSAPGKKMQIELAKMKNYFTKEWGDSILKFLIGLADRFGGLDKAAATLMNRVLPFLATLIAIKGVIPGTVAGFNFMRLALNTLSVSVGIVDKGTKALTLSTTALASAQTFGLSIAIYALVEAWQYASKAEERYLEGLKKVIDSNNEILDKAAEEETKKLSETNKKWDDAFKERYRIFHLFIATIRQVNTRMIDELTESMKQYTKVINAEYKILIDGLEAGIKKIKDQASAAKAEAEKAQAFLDRLKQRGDEFAFEARLKGKTPEEQQTILLDEAKRQRLVGLGAKDTKSAEHAWNKFEKIMARYHDVSLKMIEDEASENVRVQVTEEKNLERSLNKKKKAQEAYFNSVQRIRRRTFGSRYQQRIGRNQQRMADAAIRYQQRMADAGVEGVDPTRKQLVNEEFQRLQKKEESAKKVQLIELATEQTRLEFEKKSEERLKAKRKEEEEEGKKALAREMYLIRFKEKMKELEAYKFDPKKGGKSVEAEQLINEAKWAAILAGVEKEQLNTYFGQIEARQKVLRTLEGQQLISENLLKLQKVANDNEKEQIANKDALAKATGERNAAELDYKKVWFDNLLLIDAEISKRKSTAFGWAELGNKKEYERFQDLQEIQKLLTILEYTDQTDESNKTPYFYQRKIESLQMLSKMMKEASLYGKGMSILTDKNTYTDQAVIIENMTKSTEKLAKAKKEFNEVESKKGQLEEDLAALDAALALIPPEYRAQIEAMKEAAKAEVDTIQTRRDAIRLLAIDLVRLAELYPTIFQTPIKPNPVGQNQATGGFVRRFASGGPVGTDTIPAWLSPGEYIWNARTTRQYYPLINALNRSTGNTTNVGDINVTVKGGDTSQMTVRNIGQALRREIRRGTVKLN